MMITRMTTHRIELETAIDLTTRYTPCTAAATTLCVDANQSWGWCSLLMIIVHYPPHSGTVPRCGVTGPGLTVLRSGQLPQQAG